jgi:hypothetical protein
MEIKNLRNYEVLNENPRITYIEADYINCTEWEKNYGYMKEIGEEKMFIFSADRPDRLKKIYKESCVKNVLEPKETIVIKS